MSTLTQRAAVAIAGDEPPVEDVPCIEPAGVELPDMSAFLPAAGEDWDMVPVHIAWLRVRRDVAYIDKGDAYEERGVHKYNFRGYERVVGAFGPITLRHGVSVSPHRVTPNHRDAKSGKGTAMREATTKITWRVYGPLGDFMEMESEGESLDYGDKGTAKAQTIAQRMVLLIGGMIPTGAPDSDESGIERGEAPVRPAESYRDEILDRKTTVDRLNQIRVELRNVGMLNAQVMNETGDMESLDSIGGRMYADRTGGAA